MTHAPTEEFERQMAALGPVTPQAVPQLVDIMLDVARRYGASDVHLVPTAGELEMSWRMDGALQRIFAFDGELKSNIVARLKVLAQLLTYRVDVPQEGRIVAGPTDCEMRVGSFPTIFGEKAVVRLSVGSGQYSRLDDLNLGREVDRVLRHSLYETGGLILVTGPAGSGKTTTVYACLREIIHAHPAARSIATLEDPVESILAGAAQSQINSVAGFDFERGLKSLLRQDPEVIVVGEMRDPGTAAVALQAALTGHLVLSTFHAGSAAEAVARLLDLGIEPYQLRSGLLSVVNQRLFRVLCDCAEECTNADERLGFEIERFRRPMGCDECNGTGYRRRQPLAELLTLDDRAAAAAVLSREDAAEIERRAVEAGMITRWQQALAVLRSGETSPTELRRVLGFRALPGRTDSEKLRASGENL